MGGIWALFTRSLRLDARDRWTHGLRLATLLIGYWAFWNAQSQMRWFGAPGLRFFEMLVILNAWLILLAGIGYFSSVISEEKEENTLGLMLMTGLSPLGLLIGKGGGRLIQAALLILLQIPLAMLAITLGGITLKQVYASVVVLMALLYLVGTVAMLWSVLCRTTRGASMAVIITAVVYGFGAGFCEAVYRLITRGGVVAPYWKVACEAFCFRRIVLLFQSSGSPDLITPCETACFIAGSACFLLSWGLFGWAVRQPDTAPLSRAWWLPRSPRFRLGSPGRVWPMAVAWKELFFTLGGWQWLAIKAAGYALIPIIVVAYWAGFERGPNRMNYAQEVCVICFSLAMALEGSVLASRVFSDEIRQQTWSTLYLTPLSVSEVVLVKWVAVLVGLLPVVMFDFVAIFSSEFGVRNFIDILDDAMFYGVVAMFFTCAHLAAVFSLYVRWGAVPLAGGVVWLSFAMLMVVGQPGLRERDAGVIAVFASLLACVIAHGWIFIRLEQLAAE
ncbi:MAG: hypothetical protein Q8K78_03365 [Planctomycetaceae bacterium]|nr:hypothetical protein [Planctomycetaceae bacterium]